MANNLTHFIGGAALTGVAGLMGSFIEYEHADAFAMMGASFALGYFSPRSRALGLEFGNLEKIGKGLLSAGITGGAFAAAGYYLLPESFQYEEIATITIGALAGGAASALNRMGVQREFDKKQRDFIV